MRRRSTSCWARRASTRPASSSCLLEGTSAGGGNRPRGATCRPKARRRPKNSCSCDTVSRSGTSCSTRGPSPHPLQARRRVAAGVQDVGRARPGLGASTRLNMEGLEQAQELARALKGDGRSTAATRPTRRRCGRRLGCHMFLEHEKSAPDGGRPSSGRSRRRASTGAAPGNFHERDTVALAAPGEAPRSRAAGPAFRRLHASRNAGTKPLRGHGGERLKAFCDWAMARPEATIVVAATALVPVVLPLYLPAEAEHDGKRFKVANGGVVACVLELVADFVRFVHQGGARVRPEEEEGRVTTKGITGAGAEVRWSPHGRPRPNCRVRVRAPC